MKTLKQNWQMVAVCVAMLATAFLIISAQTVFGNVTAEAPTVQDTFRTYTFFATSTNQTTYATSTTATSTNITQWLDSNGAVDTGAMDIRGAKKVTFYFQRTGVNGNEGTSKFQVQVSPDGTNWFYFDKWVENASSTVGTSAITRTTSDLNLTGTTTVAQSMVLLDDGYLSARCIVRETTDGEHYCKATAQY